MKKYWQDRSSHDLRMSMSWQLFRIVSNTEPISSKELKKLQKKLNEHILSLVFSVHVIKTFTFSYSRIFKNLKHERPRTFVIGKNSGVGYETVKECYNYVQNVIFSRNKQKNEDEIYLFYTLSRELNS